MAAGEIRRIGGNINANGLHDTTEEGNVPNTTGTDPQILTSTGWTGTAPNSEQVLSSDESWGVPSEATTSRQGMAPALSNDDTEFLRADGNWATPPDTLVDDSLVTTSSEGLLNPRNGKGTHHLRANGAWGAPRALPFLYAIGYQGSATWQVTYNQFIPWTIVLEHSPFTSITASGGSDFTLAPGYIYEVEASLSVSISSVADYASYVWCLTLGYSTTFGTRGFTTKQNADTHGSEKTARAIINATEETVIRLRAEAVDGSSVTNNDNKIMFKGDPAGAYPTGWMIIKNLGSNS